MKKMHAEILNFQCFKPLFALLWNTIFTVLTKLPENWLRAKRMRGKRPSRSIFSSMKFSKVAAKKGRQDYSLFTSPVTWTTTSHCGIIVSVILRGKHTHIWYARRREALRDEIQRIYDESNQIFGSGKICAVMKENGISVSKEMVRELMSDLNP